MLNVSIVKPLASAPFLESMSKTGVAVTAEEHRVAGGLADAVRTVAAEQHPVPIFAVGMGNDFRDLRHRRSLHGALRLTASGIADRAREALLLKPIVSAAALRSRVDLEPWLPEGGPADRHPRRGTGGDLIVFG